MSNNTSGTWSVSFSAEDLKNKDKMDAFQEAYDKAMDELNIYIHDLATELGVTFSWASSIYYLRTRSRWTQELENELIRMAKAGEPMPNMNEWPPKEDKMCCGSGCCCGGDCGE